MAYSLAPRRIDNSYFERKILRLLPDGDYTSSELAELIKDGSLRFAEAHSTDV